MEIFTFIFYLIICSILVIKIPFFKHSGIGKLPLLILFYIKVLAGFAYAKFYLLPKYYKGSDTWRFYRLSLQESKWLLSNPYAFIKDLFVYGYTSSGNLFSGENSYWNDLKSNIPVKLLALMNIITHYSYYSSIILFNVIFLVGQVALYKVFQPLFPRKKWLIIIGIFLLPSTLFWCSGIHKDGLILSAIGVVVYSLNSLTKNNFLVTLLATIFCLLLLFGLRNYICLAMLPAMLTWLVCIKFPDKRIKFTILIYVTGIALFFLSSMVATSINFPAFIANKQHEFLLLEGGSSISKTSLQPTFPGFISYLPKALDVALFRPHLNEIKNVAYIPAALEVLFLILVAILVAYGTCSRKNAPSFFFFCFTFSLSALLICGYTITFTGAIVRYRSVILPLLVTPLLCISKLPLTKFDITKSKNILKTDY